MVGFHLSAFMNGCDFDELAAGILQNSSASRNLGQEFSIALRVKSVISSRGRIVTFKQAFEKVFSLSLIVFTSINYH